MRHQLINYSSGIAVVKMSSGIIRPMTGAAENVIHPSEHLPGSVSPTVSIHSSRVSQSRAGLSRLTGQVDIDDGLFV